MHRLVNGAAAGHLVRLVHGNDYETVMEDFYGGQKWLVVRLPAVDSGFQGLID